MREGRCRDAAAHTDTPGAAVAVAREDSGQRTTCRDPRESPRLRVAGCTSALHPENVRPNGTKCSCRHRADACAQASPADDGAAEGDERLVDVVADLPADAQAAEPVQQSDRSFRDPAVDAEAGAVFGAARAMCGMICTARTRSR